MKRSSLGGAWESNEVKRSIAHKRLQWWDKTLLWDLCVLEIYEIATDHSELFIWKHLQQVSELAHSYLKILRYVN